MKKADHVSMTGFELVRPLFQKNRTASSAQYTTGSLAISRGFMVYAYGRTS